MVVTILNYLVRGGPLDFSYLNELKNIYITDISMKKKKKKYKSSITKNDRITKKIFFYCIPLKGYVAS